MQTTDYETAPSAPTPPPTWRRAGHRAAAVMGTIAAVLVIALITTALVASHTSGKLSPTATQPGASATSSQTWQPLPHLANLSNETWLAPSDPRVVYQFTLNDQGKAASLRRSDDQGATWKNLSLPAGTGQAISTQVYITPTNAQHVLVINGITCPTGQAAAAGPLAILSDGHTCSVVYFSSNGGAHWAPVTLPAHGSHNLFMGAGIFAQENRLYAILFVEPGITASELVESRDDGATWQFADQELFAAQHCIAGAAAPLIGTTLFATILSNCSSQGSATEIWRSDDAGTHWTRAGSLPDTSPYDLSAFLEAVAVSGQAQPVLIARAFPTMNQLGFSRDSGKTWQPVPTLGNQGSGQGQVGIRKDGSLVEQAQDGFYAWKPGDSGWHKVAPALAGTMFGSLIVSDSSGKETLYMAVRGDSANSVSFYSIDLP